MVFTKFYHRGGAFQLQDQCSWTAWSSAYGIYYPSGRRLLFTNRQGVVSQKPVPPWVEPVILVIDLGLLIVVHCWTLLCYKQLFHYKQFPSSLPTSLSSITFSSSPLTCTNGLKLLFFFFTFFLFSWMTLSLGPTKRACVCVCVCVWTDVCMYVCMYVWMNEWQCNNILVNNCINLFFVLQHYMFRPSMWAIIRCV